MRRAAIGIALASLLGLVACAEDPTSTDTRTKNSALDGTFVNGEFAPAGGGWTGVDFTLDRGCAANNPVAARPSLGGWTRAALTFGRTASAVRQEIVVPNPSVVTFEVTGNVRPDDTNGWFMINLMDADEFKTTARQSGTARIKSKAFSLSVKTKSPNEKVQIILAGRGSNSWMGCYGPVLTKASLVVGEVVAPTTTSAPTTTIAPTTTPAPTTTIDPNKTCTISWDGKTLVACTAIYKVETEFYGDNGAISGHLYSSGSPSPGTSRALYYPNAKSVRISIAFADGSAISEFELNVGASVNVDFSTPPIPTTTLPPVCEVEISEGVIYTCEPIASYEFRWSDGKGTTSGRLGSSGDGRLIIFNRMTPDRFATEVIVDITFKNGRSIRGVKVPLSGSHGKVQVPYTDQ